MILKLPTEKSVKLEMDNSKAPPGKKHKISYVTYTAEERASIGISPTDASHNFYIQVALNAAII